MISHHLIRRKDFEFAASDSIIVFTEGAVVDETPPTEIQVVGGEQSVSITENTEYTTFRTASDSIVVFTEGAVVGTQGPGSVTIIGGEQAVSLTETSSYSILKTASDSISVFTEGAVVNTQSASTTIIGGEQSVSLTESTSFSVDSFYREYFSDPLTVTASACNSNSDIDPATREAADTAGQEVEITYETGNITANGSGSIQVEFVDSQQNVIAGTADPFSGTGDANQTHSFTPLSPSGTVQIQITRDLTADSVSSNGSCTDEEVTVKDPITITFV